jgi:spermidine dehydrogenase
MSETKKDIELGMRCPISRRDFLNGVAVGVGGALAGDTLLAAGVVDAKETDRARSAAAGVLGADGGDGPQNGPGYYPPALTGMRGNHDGSFTYAHALRDGKKWDAAGAPTEVEDTYDLVVVGGGISGLASAYFFRKAAGNNARILILDNHDDFGGHAKRNEFTAGGRMLLSYGGTQSIESPGLYSAVAKQLIAEIGIDVERFYKDYDRNLYKKYGTAAFFDKETFGEDRLLTGFNTTPWTEFLAKAPLLDAVRRDIARVYTEKVDYLDGLSVEQKQRKLGSISYADYLTKFCKVTPDALKFFQTFPHDLFGVGIDAVSALACYNSPDDYESFLYAGFQGLGLPELEKEEPYIFHFPDGNASVARLLVRALIPAAMPGSTMEDVVTTRADYSKLDQNDASVRLRLNSTAVHVQHVAASGGPGSNSSADGAKEVEITYSRGGALQMVRAKNCVLACYNMMIPYICPELPEKQKEAMAYLVKTPLVYTHVALRNWTSFSKLGVHQIVAPGGYHTYTAMDFPVSVGQYAFPSDPEQPMVLFMLRTPCRPGLPMRDQYRAGRAELMATPYATFERNVRDQLGRMLGGAGFDPARDIAAITVNRWAHGYAYTPNYLFDPKWTEEEKPWVIGRKPFGKIAIANSDAGANAYTNEAIDQAHRAVMELTAKG